MKSIHSRHYPEIHRLKQLERDEFKSGMVGVHYLPKVTISNIPEVLDFSNTEKVEQFLGYRRSIKKSEFDRELSEKALLDGLKAYFNEKEMEDAFIMFNQDVYYTCSDTGKQSRHERDAIVVNLTKCYILNIEAKANLSSGKKAAKQLEKTLQILKGCSFYDSIRSDWKLIRALFATSVSTQCNNCAPYIFTEDKFCENLSTLLDPLECHEDFSTHVKDFYHIVCDILPERIRIAKDLTKKFTNLNTTILKNIVQNINCTGNPQTIAFWNDQQLNLADNCLKYKRVLLSSTYSTGKTLLMINCIQELIKGNQKVLLFVDSPMETLQLQTLLQMRFHDIFKDKVKIKILDKWNPSNTSNFLENNPDYNVFIDELVYQIGPRKLMANHIKSWSELIPTNKHFWVIVGYGKNEAFDANMLFGSHFHVPQLNYPLRNPREVVEYVTLNNGVFEETFYGNSSDEISNLNISSNLTPTFSPICVDASDLGDGLHKALKVLNQQFETFTPAIFIFGGFTKVSNRFFHCGCYGGKFFKLSLTHKNSSTTNWHSFTNMMKVSLLFMFHRKKMYQYAKQIFHAMNRPEPLIYGVNEDDFINAREWVTGQKKHDLITVNSFAQGFEHNVVVVFEYQKDQYCNVNACMRTTGMLIIVKVPEKPLDNICFGKCQQT